MEFDNDFRYEIDGPVRRIILNRPEKHNALSVSMQKQLHEAVRAVRFDEDARVLIISGAGNTFCAGDDIAEFPILNTRRLAFDSAVPLAEPSSNPQANTFLIVSMFQETAAMLEALVDVVTIAAVDGVCMGGGLELTLCCDFVFTTPDARWGMPEIDMGITPDGVGAPAFSASPVDDVPRRSTSSATSSVGGRRRNGIWPTASWPERTSTPRCRTSLH